MSTVTRRLLTSTHSKSTIWSTWNGIETNACKNSIALLIRIQFVPPQFRISCSVDWNKFTKASFHPRALRQVTVLVKVDGFVSSWTRSCLRAHVGYGKSTFMSISYVFIHAAAFCLIPWMLTLHAFSELISWEFDKTVMIRAVTKLGRGELTFQFYYDRRLKQLRLSINWRLFRRSTPVRIRIHLHRRLLRLERRQR